MGKRNDYSWVLNNGSEKKHFSDCVSKEHAVNHVHILKLVIIFFAFGGFAFIQTSQSFAVSLFSFRNMRDYASGDLAYCPGLGLQKTSRGSRTGFVIQAGELRPFEIPGLKVNSINLELRSKLLSLSLLFSSLSSPVGGERLWSLRIGCEDWNRTSFITDINLYVQDLNAVHREVLLSCSLEMFFSISNNLGAGYKLGDLPLSGEKMPGVDASAFIGFITSGGSYVLPFLSLDRLGQRGLGFAVCIRLLKECMKLISSFDSNTGEIRSALGIDIGSVGLTFGAAIHPVLGTSKGVTVAWRL